MQTKSFGLMLAAIAIGALGGFAQQRDDGVTIKTIGVRGPISMLEGQGGNIGISAGPDGVLMIDDQFDRLAEKIQVAIKELGKGDIKFVVNTHHHGDHTGGNKFFGKRAPILAHENVRNRLAAGANAVKEELPVVTFKDGISLHFNGEEIRVVHFARGHTDGDSIVFFTGSNVVHMGDHFFSGRFPYVDLGGGGDVEGYMKNIESAIDMLAPDVKIIPGHGPLSTLDDLKASLAMMRETTSIVRKHLKNGKTLEETKTAGLPKKWESWAWQFIGTERWIEIVYKSLSRKKR